MRAFDQAGKVCDYERFLVRFLANGNDTDIRLQCGEGILGNLRLSSGDARDQRGLAGIGIADEADIGQQLQLEAEIALFAGTAHLVLARSLVRGRGEVLIAAATTAAFGDDDTLVRLLKVVD